jgi:glycosyltransferase involved in cell wall biosynthesis
MNDPQQNKRFRVLFLTPYYPPEVGAAQTRTEDFALRLSRSGYDVSVLTTFPNYPSGIVPMEWRGKFFWKGTDDSARIYRVWSYISPGGRFWIRLLNNLTFALFATLIGIWLAKPDVIVVESHPLFNGVAAIILSTFKRAPFVLNVSDLWPESAIQLGALKNPVLIWLAEKFEQLAYRRAAIILAMSRGIWNKIRHDGIGDSKVLLFRNAVDCDVFRPGLDGLTMRVQLGVAPDAFIVLYAGTFGFFNDTKVILETAARFQRENNSRVQFVFVGDGKEKRKLQDFVAQNGLTNVRLVRPIPKAGMPTLLAASNCVVIARKNHDTGTLPRKLFEAMASAKPVVLAASGEAEDELRMAGGGICVPPEDSASLRDAVLQLLTNPERANDMGRKGRQYAEVHFSHSKRTRELLDHLQSLLCAPNGGMQTRLPETVPGHHAKRGAQVS